jgi:hypothetical protein
MFREERVILKKNRLIIIVCLVTFLITACSPSPQAIQKAIVETQAGWTPIPTQTPFPTLTSYPTYTLQPTIVVTKVVTVTFTPTLEFTPTKSGTPTVTPNINATSTAAAFAILKQNKGDGNYLVGVDIAPGVWRNNGESDSCYWETTTRMGDIIKNYFGDGGGTAYIGSTNFAFQSKRCGTWTFLSNP